MTNFRLSKLKHFAEDNFKLDENGKKLSNGLENTVGKGKIACYGQFLHKVFSKELFFTHVRIRTCMGKG